MTSGDAEVARYVLTESVETLDGRTAQNLKEAFLDIVGCTLAGVRAEASAIVGRFAERQWGSGQSTVLLQNHRLQATGAALVNAAMANALDLDDGHRLTKGHPGAAVFPAVLAAAEEWEVTGKEFLTALLVGYEVAIRAGILAHRLRPEYHSTGSWGAIGAAAGVARVLGLGAEEIGEALGIAESHATYAPMMRCIDHPAMLKDGICWGSMTGVSAAYLAAEGFTGIPSLFCQDEAHPLVAELGAQYRINELYFKPYACCRWAQPAVEGVRHVLAKEGLTHDRVAKVVIYTFDEAARLAQSPPTNTEEAQYNLFFPLAAYLVFGEVGPRQVLDELRNPRILEWMEKIEVATAPEMNAAFPEKAKCRIEVMTSNGERFCSPALQARGDYDTPLSYEEKKEKFLRLTTPLLGETGSLRLKEKLENVDQLDNMRALFSEIRR